MSDTVNPWQSPNTEVAAEDGVPREVLTTVMIRCLKETSPWLRFIGVLGHIGAVFLVVIGLVFSILTMAGLGAYTVDAFGGLSGTLVGLIYLAMGVVAFFPARFTYRFGAKIRNYLLSGGTGDLEGAFRYNRALWKFYGILAIVYLAFIPLGIIGVVVATVMSLT
jgi:hypothetical protein